MLQLTRDQEKQEQLSNSIRKLAVTDAAVRIVDEIEKILKIKEDE